MTQAGGLRQRNESSRIPDSPADGGIQVGREQDVAREQYRAEKQLEGLAGVLGSPVRGVALLQVRKDEGPALGQEDGP